MSTYGYASDVHNGEWLLMTYGQPDKLQGDNLLLFNDDLDVFAGQSGSGVLTTSDIGSEVVIGVVSHHSYFPEYNGIVALTQASVALIDEWVASNNQNLTPPKTTTYYFEEVQNISLLYMGLFNRLPDEEGLNYWLKELSGGAEFYNIVGGFLNSDELNRGTDYTGDTKNFVQSLYTNILNREADTEGLNYWVSELNTFSSKEKVVTGFLESLEYQNQNALNTYTLWHNWFEGFKREVTGTSDAEIIKTTPNDDYIDAGGGDDIINGLGGDDYIYSNEGSDSITGGDGSDFFVFDLTQKGVDTITDFNIQEDKIKLSSQNVSVANIEGEETLVLYEDEDSYIILIGLVKDDYASIMFV